MNLKKIGVAACSTISLLVSTNLLAVNTHVNGPSSLSAGKYGYYKMYTAGGGMQSGQEFSSESYNTFKVRKPNGKYYYSPDIAMEQCYKESLGAYYCRSKSFKYRSSIGGKHNIRGHGTIYVDWGNSTYNLTSQTAAKDVFVKVDGPHR